MSQMWRSPKSALEQGSWLVADSCTTGWDAADIWTKIVSVCEAVDVPRVGVHCVGYSGLVALRVVERG